MDEGGGFDNGDEFDKDEWEQQMAAQKINETNNRI